jgi:3-oxoacyl-[acyl-carrier protein] reductase
MDQPVALITGAASGIGRHFAGVLHKKNYRLALADINEKGLSEAFEADSEQLILHRLDVTRAKDWRTFVDQAHQRFGRIDYLFNIAGIIAPGYVHETEVELIDRHLDINSKGVMYGTRLAGERMVEQGRGHIINMASMAGLAPIAGIALYSASKFAVRGFSIASAYELRPRGVYVSVVSPDLVATPMLDLQLNYPEAAMTFSGNGRPLTVEDVGRALLSVMETKAIEVTLPRTRGWLGKLGNLFPSLGLRVTEYLRRKGLKRLEKLRENNPF